MKIKRFSTLKIFGVIWIATLLLVGCSSNSNTTTKSSDNKGVFEEVELQDADHNFMSVKEYRDFQTDLLLDVFRPTIINLNDKLKEANQNRSLKKDSDWINSLEAVFDPIDDTIPLLNDMIAENKISNELMNVHLTTIDAFKLMQQAGDKLVNGTITNNKDMLKVGKEFINEAQDKMEESLDLAAEAN